jgi:hypothetical protein
MPVIPKSRHQHGLPRQTGKLHRCDCPTTGRLLEGILRVHDLAGRRDVAYAGEGDPLDVAYNRDLGRTWLHGRSVTYS